MEDEFDRFARKLQETMLADARKVFSEKVIELFLNPKNLGKIENADGAATLTGPCGDTMQIWLKIRKGKIVRAGFMTDGCGPTIACGSMITQLVKGKSIEEALKIVPEEVTEALDGLPESHVHCSLLCVNTLRSAIDNYLSAKK